MTWKIVAKAHRCAPRALGRFTLLRWGSVVECQVPGCGQRWRKASGALWLEVPKP